MIRLFLVRHGLTEWNRNGRYQGQLDVPLSEEGRRQVAALAERLRGMQFDCCYTSSLSRARESAAIILAGCTCPVYEDADLNEMSYGRWEGLTRPQIQAQFPEDWTQFLADRVDHAPLGGETVGDLAIRIRRFLATLELHYEGRETSLLIVAHGGSLRAIVAAYLELSLQNARRLRIDNASLSIVEVYPGDAALSLFNDTSHLEPGKTPPDRQPAH